MKSYKYLLLFSLIFSCSFLALAQEVTQKEITLVEIPDNSIERESKSFWESFWAGFWLIVVAEIGDNTFFLTMIYAATNSVMKTLIVSSVCMLILNVLSLVIGYSIPYLISRSTLDWITIIIFTIFGINLLYEGIRKSESLEEELNEVKEEINYSESQAATKSEERDPEDVENQNLKENLIPKEKPNKGRLITQSVWAYSLTIMIGEIGDRSQITTIVIATVYDFYGVLLGTSVAHVFTIILAIYCGNIVAKYLTTRQIFILGAVMFFIFAFVSILQKMALF